MKWNDLKIKHKIGSGFILLLTMVIIAGLVIFSNMLKVKNGITELSNLYLPVIYEVNNLQKSWNETIHNNRSFDFTGNQHFNDRANQGQIGIEQAIFGLQDLLKDNVDEIKEKGIDLEQTLSVLALYKETNNNYQLTIEKLNTLEEEYRSLVEEFNQPAGKQRQINLEILAKVNYTYAIVQENNLNRTFSKLPELYQKHKLELTETGATADFDAYLDLMDAYIQQVLETRMLELKRFEVSKELMWEVSKTSELGVDQIMATGNNTTLIVNQQQLIMILTLLILIIIGLVVIYSLSMSISRPLQEGIGLAERVSEGDLTVAFELNRSDEVGQLSQALQKMVHSLNNIMDEVSEGITQINTASTELTNQSLELAEGATEQAAATEQVSSSMEEMHANIKHNADNSSTAENISVEAAKGIIISNEATKTAGVQLDKITSKINIIVDIASQTNLLALNAAVEAARAGAYGKGFAVVASEVRKLAERSQDAAKGITEISLSTMEASQDSINKLENITPEIQRTANLVEEITIASKEQVIGVEQINSAVLQLNDVTQRNASNAEQIKLAINSLQEMADKLKRTIHVFKTE